MWLAIAIAIIACIVLLLRRAYIRGAAASCALPVLSAIAITLGVLTTLTTNVWYYGNQFPLRYNRHLLLGIKDYLRDYRQTAGHYPTNDEGLLAVPKLVHDAKESAYLPKDNKIIYIQMWKSGPESALGGPFIYENRNGLDSRKFTYSHANTSSDTAYSIRVDKGIYVWSPSAFERCGEIEDERKAGYTLGIGLILIGLAAFFMHTRVTTQNKPLKTKLLKASSLLLVDAIILAASYSAWWSHNGRYTGSCYEVVHQFPRTPQTIQYYKDTLEKYNKCGVLSDKAYKKMIDTVEHDQRLDEGF